MRKDRDVNLRVMGGIPSGARAVARRLGFVTRLPVWVFARNARSIFDPWLLGDTKKRSWRDRESQRDP
jgi:hypothetical protein